MENHSMHGSKMNNDAQKHSLENMPASGHSQHKDHYVKLLIMMVLSFIAMYILMYAMVDKLGNVIPNYNQFFMAGLMSAPMLIIEMAVMGKMYPNKKLNLALLGAGVVLLSLFWFAIRGQAGIKDEQFLKSMIPHHAGALLMVEQSDLSDPEIKKLGEDIIKSQEKEIQFMKAKIKQLEAK